MKRHSVKFIMSLLMLALLFSGCQQEVGGSSRPDVPAIPDVPPTPVTITYNATDLSIAVGGEVVASGSTVLSSTDIVISPVAKTPVLFLTANGLPIAYTGATATYKVPSDVETIAFDTERKELDENPEQYKVRLLFAGEKNTQITTTANFDSYEMLKGWFTAGTSTRKADFVFVNDSYRKENFDYNDFMETIYPITFAQAPHAVVVQLGLAELKADSFDEKAFTAWYAGILSGYGRVREGAAVVAVGLPPFANFTDVDKTRYDSVDKAIRTAATKTGATLVDISDLYAKDSVLATDTGKAKRRITEEIFLAFYSKIEAEAGNPADMMIDGKPITTTPRQKWLGGNGNQDADKKTLIEDIKAAGKEKWPQVIFTGDSITDFFDGTADDEGWTKINDVSEKRMAAWWDENAGWTNDNKLAETGDALIYRALNLGNSGDFTQSLLYRWQKLDGDTGSGAYTGAFEFSDTVKAVVLMIGTNNIGVSSQSKYDLDSFKEQERPISSVETIKGIQSVIEVLKNGFPNAKIILMGVLPRGTYASKIKTIDFIRLQVLSTNRQLKNLYGSGKDSRVWWLDLYEKFVTSDGAQITGTGLDCLSGVASCTTLFADTVHPSNAGYKIWWDNLKPLLDAAIKE